MKRKRLTVCTPLLVLWVLVLSACQPLPTAVVPITPASPTLEVEPPTSLPAPTDKMTMEVDEITSQALANNLFGDPATRSFVVLLPPSYATTSHSYPVVYALHDWDRDEYSLVMPIKDAFEGLWRQGAEDEMIFVFPNSANSFLGSSYMSSPTIGDYETYITRELVDYIDAHYRTIPTSDSRGITGCGGHGGTGSLLLAMKYPHIFSVVAPVTGAYDYEHGPWLEWGAERFHSVPADFAELERFDWPVWVGFSLAAVAAPNLDKPPFYLDMPYEVVDGKGQLVPVVFQKIVALDATHQLPNYLQQPARLQGIMIYHGSNDPYNPVENARAFDKLLTEAGVDHDYLEVSAGHCAAGIMNYEPVIEFMSKNLSFEMPE